MSFYRKSSVLVINKAKTNRRRNEGAARCVVGLFSAADQVIR